MTKLRINLLLVGCLFPLILAGCDSGPDLTEADIKASVDAAVAATTIALAPPTFTPIPTITPAGQADDQTNDTDSGEAVAVQPTDTPVPDPTDTPDPTLTPTPSAPFVAEALGNGQTRYDLPFEQFAITLSDEWLVADIFETTESAEQKQLEELLGSGIFRSLVAAGYTFYAINWNELSRESISPVNISLTTQDAAELAQQSIDWLSPDVVEQLTYQLGIEPEAVQQSPATLGDQATTRLAYSLPQPSPLDRDVTLDFVLHITQAGGRAYVLAITAPSDISAELLPAAEAALQAAEFYGK